jgi:hypothetical protein
LFYRKKVCDIGDAKNKVLTRAAGVCPRVIGSAASRRNHGDLIMKKASLLLLIIVALVSVVPCASQSAEFRRETLRPKARVAYNKLFSACVFRIGGVGFSGQISKEELALYDLLDDEQDINALKSLVATGSYEGALYGLLGLSIRNHAEFNMAVEIYKARKEPPEWQTTASFECFRAETEMVTTQSGCIIHSESRDKVVADIQSGRFDKLLNGKYRPNESLRASPF